MFAWKLWAKGLAAAAIGGSVDAVVEVGKPLLVSLTSGAHATLPEPSHLATTALVAGALTGLGYLRTHPPDISALPDAIEPLAAAGVAAGVSALERKLPKAKR